MRLKKAQTWGFDLIIAVTIFSVGILFFYFYTINYPGQEEDTLTKLTYEAGLISDSLLSEGSPTNWQTNNVARIGLLSDGKLNQTKLNNFDDLINANYNRTKSLFRIKDNYYIEFQDPITISGEQKTQLGLNSTNPANLAKVTRVAIYENNLTSINIFVWN